MLTLNQITLLFDTRGTAWYGSEAISQQQHALQCAQLALQAGGSDQLVAAALLHDLGHLLPVNSAPGASSDDFHQHRAIPLLTELFGEAVLAPIRLHVDAKRYLCRIDSRYALSLSPASRRSLALQGGPFSDVEAQAFIALPHATDAVALRRWDDLAKDPMAKTPDWACFMPALRRAQSLADR